MTINVQLPGAVMSIPDLAQAMIVAVDSRLATAGAPSDSMKLFSGIGPVYTGTDYPLNTACWLHDLREQITGVCMYAGNYTQGYDLAPLGDHYALCCGHNGPEPLPLTCRWVNVDGTVHTNTATHQINDYPSGEADLQIYVFADPFSEWVKRIPIIALTLAERAAMAAFDPPTMAVSQGTWMNGPTTPYGYADTPDNRMAYVKSLSLATLLTTLRNPFFHAAFTGDSGTKEYVLTNDTLYMLRVITQGSGAGVFICDHIDYVNSLIAEGATASGHAPITISAIRATYPPR